MRDRRARVFFRLALRVIARGVLTRGGVARLVITRGVKGRHAPALFGAPFADNAHDQGARSVVCQARESDPPASGKAGLVAGRLRARRRRRSGVHGRDRARRIEAARLQDTGQDRQGSRHHPRTVVAHQTDHAQRSDRPRPTRPHLTRGSA